MTVPKPAGGPPTKQEIEQAEAYAGSVVARLVAQRAVVDMEEVNWLCVQLQHGGLSDAESMTKARKVQAILSYWRRFAEGGGDAV